MPFSLATLQSRRMHLYSTYRSGLLDLEEYLEQIRPLDKAIDQLEMNALKTFLQGSPVFETPSSKHLR